MGHGDRWACERCGRFVDRGAGCPTHRGARLLDLRRSDDHAWRTGVLAMRRHRHLRLATAAAGTAGMVLALVALTNLVASGTAAHIYGEVGVTWFLSHVLQVLSVGLVVGGLSWGGLGLARVFRARRTLTDSIDRQAADREMARRATAVLTSVTFAISVYVLRHVLVGVPAELAAAAASLVLTPPILAVLEATVTERVVNVESAGLLPPVADETPADTRADDPLERARRNGLRRSIMDRR